MLLAAEFNGIGYGYNGPYPDPQVDTFDDGAQRDAFGLLLVT